MAFGYLHVSDGGAASSIEDHRGERHKLGAIQSGLIHDCRSLTQSLSGLLRISPGMYIYTGRQAWFNNFRPEVQTESFDSTRPSTQPVGNTTIA